MSEQLRLVVAEDDDTDALLIAKNLARAGMQCTMRRVQTESDFVDALHDVQPDVIISDFSMPQFDGRRALEIAATRAPETPFLFVSGTIGEQRAIDALRCGATDYILKSNMTRLPAAIQRALREAALKAAQRASQQQLQSNEEQLRGTVETSQDWIWETDTQGRFRFCSQAVANMLGYAPDELIGRDFRDLLPDDSRRRADELLPAAAGKQVTGAVASWRTSNGEYRWLERNAVAVIDEQGEVTGYRGTDRDITARREQEARLQRLTRSYRMLSSTGSAILRLRNRAELLNEICRIAVEQGNYARVAISMGDANAGELTLEASAGAEPALAIEYADLGVDLPATNFAERTIRTGKTGICNDLRTQAEQIQGAGMLLERGFEAFATLPITVDGITVGVLTLCSLQAGVFDVSELEVLQELTANLGYALQFLEQDETVHFLSYFDSLTGLAKRQLFCQRVTHALAADSLQPRSMQVVVFDIQKLGAINDSFGRFVGDRLIENMAARLKHAYGDPDKLAYLGGGSFAVTLPDISHGGDLGPLLQYSVGRLFVEPIQIDGECLRPTIRYGVASFPQDATSAETLMQYAEAALSAARENNERYVSYSSMAQRPRTRGFALESRLASALDRDEFQLYYQPKIDLATGEIRGFEALLRWQDTDEGLVLPSVFIPLLERSGAIIDVGAWALQRAADDIRLWHDAGCEDVRVAVNVSALQLRRRDFPRQVLSCLDCYGGRAGLDIEITESMLMQDIELSIRKLSELREAGVDVAIDDFGTGYSSLRLLSKLPVSTLKIDHSFVEGGCESRGGMTLLATIISLARSLGMKSIAEGVQNAEQLQMMRSLECDEAQGFFFAQPTTADQIPAMMRRVVGTALAS
jgi:PAS domain S-box-containing protein/diguanylate cyclase (GGDEF)-like protein